MGSTFPENGAKPEEFFVADGVSDSNVAIASKVEDAAPVVLSPEQDKVLTAVRGGRSIFYSGPAVSAILIECI